MVEVGFWMVRAAVEAQTTLGKDKLTISLVHMHGGEDVWQCKKLFDNVARRFFIEWNETVHVGNLIDRQQFGFVVALDVVDDEGERCRRVRQRKLPDCFRCDEVREAGNHCKENDDYGKEPNEDQALNRTHFSSSLRGIYLGFLSKRQFSPIIES